VLRIKTEACPRMLNMVWKKNVCNLLEDDDWVEDKGRSLSQDVEYGVKKEWNLLEDDDCLEDKESSLSQDVEYSVEKNGTY
jgi:hypothetical protein